MEYCFWFWHELKENLPDEEVSGVERVAVHKQPHGTLYMFIGKAHCIKCGAEMNVHREGWIAPGERLGPWQIAKNVHLRIFANFQKRFQG